ncbi:MAG: uracil-DNA glycosylase family protein [Euryarchaeota archaeon]|nr:uracil-DNA glycosylase family protein [Euryarchaeota archaeon]
MRLNNIWRVIEKREKCQSCVLKKKSEPLLFKIDSEPNIMVVTEGSNIRTEKEFIASMGNHPTFTFLSALFEGNFHPLGKNTNVYWTHLRKCFLKDTTSKYYDRYEEVKKALEICSSNYLIKEIEALKPRLIVAVGGKSISFFSKYDKRLKGNIKDLFLEEGGIFPKVKINEMSCDIVVMYHPSGLNRSWAELTGKPKDTVEVFKKIQKKINENLG